MISYWLKLKLFLQFLIRFCVDNYLVIYK